MLTWQRSARLSVTCCLIPGSGEVSKPSSPPELKKTSSVSWSDTSTSSIWSSKSTFTSMDEMLPIVAAEAESKTGNGAKLKPWERNKPASQSTHVSCSLGYRGAPTTGRRPRRAGRPPRRSAASPSVWAAGPHPSLEASGRAHSPLQVNTRGSHRVNNRSTVSHLQVCLDPNRIQAIKVGECVLLFSLLATRGRHWARITTTKLLILFNLWHYIYCNIFNSGFHKKK